MLGNDHSPGTRDFGNGIPNIIPALGCKAFEATKVTTADVVGALDQMSGYERIGELEKIVGTASTALDEACCVYV